MLKGLAITPPVIGRISIGRIFEKDGKRLPKKDDQFTITTQIQNREGWLAHPLNETLRKDANQKLRSIPVQMLFNDPDLNFRAEYSAFDKQTGRPVCVGNGETCRRATLEGIESLPCPAPEGCEFGRGTCKPYGRLNVVVGEEDSFGTFIFRTTSFNSIRTLAARLRYYEAASGGVLASMPLELRLRGKSTTQSHRSAIYYVDLTLRDGESLESTIEQARGLDACRKASGFDQHALDEAARHGFANGAFEDSDDEGPSVIDDLTPAEGEEEVEQAPTSSRLNAKLGRKLNARAPEAAVE